MQYAPHRKIELEAVAALHGVAVVENAKQSIFVTTSAYLPCRADTSGSLKPPGSGSPAFSFSVSCILGDDGTNEKDNCSAFGVLYGIKAMSWQPRKPCDCDALPRPQSTAPAEQPGALCQSDRPVLARLYKYGMVRAPELPNLPLCFLPNSRFQQKS
jgi:hypothetical protein